MSKAKVELLDTVDIFDFYGCEFLWKNVEGEDKEFIKERLIDIHAKYLHAVKERIKAEFGFLGIDDWGGFSVKKMIKMLPELMEKQVADKADEMRVMGTGVNMMAGILQARALSGEDVSEEAKMFGVDAGPVKKNSINTDSMINNPKWHVIAEAFIDIEDAQTIPEMIKSVDYLNDLQHNSFHILIDLQTGRMLEGQSEGEGYGKHGKAVDIVKEVLDIKYSAKSPKEYADKMSPEVRKILTANRHLYTGM